MEDLAHWAAWFSVEWRPDVRYEGKEWLPDFAQYLDEDQRKQRTKRAMRRLRRSSPRQYEVCFRVLVLGERIDDTTAWLNERAQRNCIPYPSHRPEGPHYTRKDALALLMAGIAFAKEHW